MLTLAPLFGVIVGFTLGLTGGGGSIFAVPLLVYGLSVAPREAIGTSLAVVGATALIGALQRLAAGELELRIGLLFAVSGMVGAPMGTELNRHIPESVLLALFAGLMAVVAVHMWQRSAQQVNPASRPSSPDNLPPVTMPMLSGTTFRLGLLGVLTGILSGLFGVGGGFVIVPALVLVSGLPIHRAVATSLLVITLVSLSGVVSYLSADRPLDVALAGWFVLGGIVGMLGGTQFSRQLSGPILQKGFAATLVIVATFIITQSVMD